MKLITLHQPWASLAACGLKQYETRHWAANYRGEILIHAAGKKVSKSVILSIQYALNGDCSPNELTKLEELLSSDLPLGCVIAIANLSECRKMFSRGIDDHINSSLEGHYGIHIQSQSTLERSVGCWEHGRFAFKLENAILLPQPIPFTSRQGKLLDVPPAMELMVKNQLSEVAA